MHAFYLTKINQENLIKIQMIYSYYCKVVNKTNDC